MPPSRPVSNLDVIRWSALAVAVVASALLVWQLRDILLLVFAAILVAIIFRTAADWLSERTGLPHGLSLAVVLLVIFGAIGLAGTIFGAELNAQMAELFANLPAAWSAVEVRLGDSAFGARVLERIRGAMPGGGAIMSTLQTTLSMATGVLSSLVLVIAGGIYLAAQPRYYKRGLLQLFPERKRAHVDDTIHMTGRAIRLWLVGQLVTMVAVGLVTGIGLWALDLPAPLALGLLAGVAEFVPFLGPIVSAVPALLFAASHGTDMVLWTAGLYLVVQQLEGNVITPLIQRHAVDLPPALTLFALVGLGGVFGIGGLLLAAPLTVVIFVAVKKLYVRDVLDEPTPIPGEPDDDEED